jgi:hypothetical protein
MDLTLEQCNALAPDLMAAGEFTASAVNSKLSEVPDPKPAAVEPIVTQQKAVALFDLVVGDKYTSASAGIIDNGGYNAVANAIGLWPSQVEKLEPQMNNLILAYRSE